MTATFCFLNGITWTHYMTISFIGDGTRSFPLNRLFSCFFFLSFKGGNLKKWNGQGCTGYMYFLLHLTWICFAAKLWTSTFLLLDYLNYFGISCYTESFCTNTSQEQSLATATVSNIAKEQTFSNWTEDLVPTLKLNYCCHDTMPNYFYKILTHYPHHDPGPRA